MAVEAVEALPCLSARVRFWSSSAELACIRPFPWFLASLFEFMLFCADIAKSMPSKTPAIKLSDAIRVCARFRPQNTLEIAEGGKNCIFISPDGMILVIVRCNPRSVMQRIWLHVSVCGARGGRWREEVVGEQITFSWKWTLRAHVCRVFMCPHHEKKLRTRKLHRKYVWWSPYEQQFLS